MMDALYFIPKRGNIMEFILKVVVGVLVGAWLCKGEDIEAFKDIIKGKRTLM